MLRILTSIGGAIVANNKLGGFIRHILTGVGGAAVAVGAPDVVADPLNADWMVQLQAIVGGVLALVGLFASVRAKFRS